MIKSKERISEYGEVFTSDREVKAMLHLVEHEASRIEARFFEPACGNGNFLIRVLEAKLNVVKSQYRKSQLDFEKYSFLSVASLYGIDILEDNVHECRLRLSACVRETYDAIFRDAAKQNFYDAITFVLVKNILAGDALTMKTSDGVEDLLLSEWSFTKGSKVKRIEYSLSNILAYQPFEQDSLFSDLGDEVIIPKPTKTHPQINFLDLKNEI
ncbi:hypothetical protein OAQ72_01880 [Planktomarina temperata]|nr:hypothetical protein [Planktomarina temperata]